MGPGWKTGWERKITRTVWARIVVVDGLDVAAEVELDVLLNEPGVKCAEMCRLVVHPAHSQL